MVTTLGSQIKQIVYAIELTFSELLTKSYLLS